MGRKRIPLEAFDPTTLWPVQVFNGSIEAEAAGYDRRAIARCIKQPGYTHKDLGWRIADASSHLPEFLAEVAIEDQQAKENQLISVSRLEHRFRNWAIDMVQIHGDHMVETHGVRWKQLLENKFGFDIREEQYRPIDCRDVGVRRRREYYVFGLVWKQCDKLPWC